MNRRDLLKLGAACAIAPDLITGESAEQWITIAHPGWNRNQRWYGEAVLQSMRDQLRGLNIIRTEEAYGLADLAGIVTAARIEAGSLQVQARWFGRALGIAGCFLTPSGTGRVTEPYPVKFPGWHEVETISLDRLVLNKESAFQKADAV